MLHLGHISAGADIIVQHMHPAWQQAHAVLQQQEQQQGLPLKPPISHPGQASFAAVLSAPASLTTVVLKFLQPSPLYQAGNRPASTPFIAVLYLAYTVCSDTSDALNRNAAFCMSDLQLACDPAPLPKLQYVNSSDCLLGEDDCLMTVIPARFMGMSSRSPGTFC